MATVARVSSPSVRIDASRRYQADVFGAATLVVLTMMAMVPLWYGGTIIGVDSDTQVYPWFAYLGERLRAFDLPVWNPSQFSGAPFAADPLSGWMYLPAMLIFAAFPLAIAAKVFAAFAFALAGLATYAFARVLGLSMPGALMAAVVYEFSGFSFASAPCCPTFSQGMAWMPLTLLGVELAIRANSWLARTAWWGVAGFALSQILAAWVNQRFYYALLVAGSYVAYRTLLDPPVPVERWRDRLAGLAWHGGALLLVAFGLAAAGLAPRLEYISRSNLAQGYEGPNVDVGGWSLPMFQALIARAGNEYYVGAVALALAIYAPRLVRRSFAAPYFVALAVSALVLALAQTTPLHAALYLLLPRFEELHRHFPERILIIFYLAVALLAGAAVTALRRWRIVPMLLVLLAVVDLFSAAPMALTFQENMRVDFEEHYAPSGAAEFLQSREMAEPFRYFGYDPAINFVNAGQSSLYFNGWDEPETAALVVNNRATIYGLHDLQGYNPIQPARYVAFMAALNGHSQEYHGTNVYPAGLDSPLLNLLGARYVVVPAAVPAGRPDLMHLSQRWPTVYQDDQVRVVENSEALPRVWLVHDARQVQAGEALPLLASGTVDPRETALLEDSVPTLGQPGDAARDSAVVTSYEPDRIRVETRSDAASLLMLSEVYDPNWRAYVDGKSVDVSIADHALRAVAVPAGAHTVELRYESTTLRTGLAISASAFAFLGGVWTAAAWRWWRRRTTPTTSPLPTR